jgi:hypothetical protein
MAPPKETDIKILEVLDATGREILLLTPLYFWLKFARDQEGIMENSPDDIANSLLSHPRKQDLFKVLPDEQIVKLCRDLDEIFTNDQFIALVEGAVGELVLEERITDTALTVLTIGGKKLGVPLFSTLGKWEEKKRIIRMIIVDAIKKHQALPLT